MELDCQRIWPVRVLDIGRCSNCLLHRQLGVGPHPLHRNHVVLQFRYAHQQVAEVLRQWDHVGEAQTHYPHRNIFAEHHCNYKQRTQQCCRQESKVEPRPLLAPTQGITDPHIIINLLVVL